MNLFQEISTARKLLDLSENATMEEIKSNYRSLIQRWHPDRCQEDKVACKEMTTRIIAAFRIINEYCKNYKFSFSKEEVGKYISAEEWWFDRFGRNPLWDSEKPPE